MANFCDFRDLALPSSITTWHNTSQLGSALAALSVLCEIKKNYSVGKGFRGGG